MIPIALLVDNGHSVAICICMLICNFRSTAYVTRKVCYCHCQQQLSPFTSVLNVIISFCSTYWMERWRDVTLLTERYITQNFNVQTLAKVII